MCISASKYISFDLHVVDLYHLSISPNASQEQIMMLFVYYKIMYILVPYSTKNKVLTGKFRGLFFTIQSPNYMQVNVNGCTPCINDYIANKNTTVIDVVLFEARILRNQYLCKYIT